jgi:hypothetical protein
LVSVGVFWIIKFLLFSRIFLVPEEAAVDQHLPRSEDPR